MLKFYAVLAMDLGNTSAYLRGNAWDEGESGFLLLLEDLLEVKDQAFDLHEEEDSQLL